MDFNLLSQSFLQAVSFAFFRCFLSSSQKEFMVFQEQVMKTRLKGSFPGVVNLFSFTILKIL